MTLQKKYWIFGIIGCLCFGIGDWLLGYINPEPVESGVFYFIRAGHGADYDTFKVGVTLALAAFGIYFLYPAFIHIADIAKEEKIKHVLKYTFALCTMGWIMLHLLVSVNVLVFSEAERGVGREAAVTLSKKLNNAGLPIVAFVCLFIGGAFIALIVSILRGNTVLEKTAVVFTPIVPMLIIIGISILLPSSEFAYGLYTFNMNAGMIVWFLYLLIRGD